MQSSKINIRQTTVSMCEVAVCAALLCVLSPLSIPTPFGVGFTLQVLIVLLTALILKPLHALAAQVIYTLLGIVGLPVFSNYQSGFGVIAGPTGGFIIGFIFASFFVSLAKGKENGKWTPVRYLAASVVIGIPCIYLPGILGFMFATGRDFGTAFSGRSHQMCGRLAVCTGRQQSAGAGEKKLISPISNSLCTGVH